MKATAAAAENHCFLTDASSRHTVGRFELSPAIDDFAFYLCGASVASRRRTSTNGGTQCAVSLGAETANMRKMIAELANLRPLPDEDQAEYEQLKRIEEALLEAVRDARECPLTNEEAVALVGLFGPDGCFGVAWTLLHLIESAPGWPIEECLQDTSNEWVVRLKRRIENARRLGLIP